MPRFFLIAAALVLVNTLTLGVLIVPQYAYDGLSCLQLMSFQQNRGRGGQFNHYLIDARTGFMALQREDAMWIPVNSSPRVRVMVRILPRGRQAATINVPPRYEIGLVALDQLGNVDTRRITPFVSNIALISRSITNGDARWSQSLAWSPDWTRLALRWEDSDRQAYLTLVNEDGSEASTFQLDPAQRGSADVPLAWSPDNRYLLMQASYGDLRYSLWDTQTWQEIALPFSTQFIAPTWSSTAALLSAIVTQDGTAPRILLFSPADGTHRLTDLPQNYDPDALVWSPTGRHLAVIGYQTLSTQPTLSDAKTYLFLKADGTLLSSKAEGVSRQWVVETVDYAVYAGIWAANEDRWYYLSDVPNRLPTRIALRAIDLDLDTTETIASAIPLEWASVVFNEPLQEFAARLSMGTFTFNPLLPTSPRPTTRRNLVIITGQDGVALNLHIVDTQTRQQTRLVTDADKLDIRIGTYGSGQISAQNAASDNTGIVIHWTQGADQYLSWLYADDRHYQLEDVPPLVQLNFYGSYLSYRRYDGDQQWSVMLVDLHTGERRAVLANLPPFDDARSTLAPNGDQIAVVTRSGLYLAALDGSWSKFIDPAVRQLPWWLPELQTGDRLAFLKMYGTDLRVVVVDAQGEPLLDKNIVLPNTNVVLRNIGLLGWSRCPE